MPFVEQVSPPHNHSRSLALASSTTTPPTNIDIPATSGKVLIADDTIVNRKLLATILRKEHYDIIEAADGVEAVTLALATMPDLILLDIMMPHKDGYDVCAELKHNPQSAHIPIIFLSALDEAKNKIKGLELGAADYITKPFDKDEILARVRTHIRICKLTQSLVASNQHLLEKQAQLDEDLQAASGIQQSLILKQPPAIDGLQVAWQYRPCHRIGGDIFNMYQLNETHLALFMLDVSGHGVPAAMFTVSASQSLYPQMGRLLKKKTDAPPGYTLTSPAEVLRHLDVEYPLERFGMYFTIAYGLLNFQTRQLQYSSAAHPPILVVRPDGEVHHLEAGGSIIGLGEFVPYEEETFQLLPGDRVFLYTDGIVECEDANGTPFGEKNFIDMLSALRHETLQTTCDRIIDAVLAHSADGQPQDDISLLAFSYQPA